VLEEKISGYRHQKAVEAKLIASALQNRKQRQMEMANNKSSVDVKKALQNIKVKAESSEIFQKMID
jgi:hypothetical protein